MKVMIKGGIWKNTEDEILKAAIMKYGKNQWARISSLLVRKTPKQCKSRWYEWLDPSIKKTEWAKEEDEKLLHLAKLMPTQWRTIAPIVGRTPVQCLERYQRLLDEAELKDVDNAPTAEDIRRLRPGEMDPDPEAKPARPDPIDMDEDEKEMLSEARARLANTQGKKAKRKAREKQLDEARRMALIQKRRELRAAGMDINVNKHLRGTDYNSEIPFFTKAPPGFYDVSEEREKELLNKKELLNRSMQELDGKRKMDPTEAKKLDAKKQRQKKSAGEYAPAEALQAALDAQTKRTDRKSLNLPAPQVSDMELEEIVKIGFAGENVRAMVESDGSSKALLHEYSTVTSQAIRTPRVAPGNDNLKMEARNLQALSQAQTPLLGENIVIEGSLDFETATPKSFVAQTPNMLGAHLTPRAALGAVTPSGLPARTPFRDEMGINTPRHFESDFGDTPRSSTFRPQLSSLFARLPKPKNDFDIVLPDEEGARHGNGEERIEDATDIEARNQLHAKQMEILRKARLSRPVLLELPRPLKMNMDAFEAVHVESEVDKLVREELKALMIHDAIENPYPGSIPSKFNNCDYTYQEIENVYLEEACKLIDEEYALLMKSMSQTALQDTIKEAETLSAQYMCINGSFQLKKDICEGDMLEFYKKMLEANKTEMKSLAGKGMRLEKKANTLLSGYQSKCSSLAQDMVEKQNTLAKKKIELECLRAMKIQEDIAGIVRLENIVKEVDTLKIRNQILQKEYSGLLNKRNDLLLNK